VLLRFALRGQKGNFDIHLKNFLLDLVTENAITLLLTTFLWVINDVPGNMMQYSKVSSKAGIILVITKSEV
jgi:hypothetical protein